MRHRSMEVFGLRSNQEGEVGFRGLQRCQLGFSRIKADIAYSYCCPERGHIVYLRMKARRLDGLEGELSCENSIKLADTDQYTVHKAPLAPAASVVSPRAHLI